MRKCFFSLSLEKLKQNSKATVKTCGLFIYGDVHYVNSSFKKSAKNSNILASVVNFIFHTFSLTLSVYFYFPWCTGKTQVHLYTQSSLYVTHSSFCVLNYILSDAEQILPKLPAPNKRLSTPSVGEELPNLADKIPSDYVLWLAINLQVYNEKSINLLNKVDFITGKQNWPQSVWQSGLQYKICSEHQAGMDNFLLARQRISTRGSEREA
jgi:hypothetical protein